METMTAAKSFSIVKRHAESIKNDEPQRVADWSVNDAWPQGDVLLVCLDKIPSGVVEMAKPEIQLAPGTTQGSRHCLDSLQGIRMFRVANPTPLDGPVIVSDREFTVEHPEHGNITLPAGIVGVVYQRAFADELRRTQD